MHRHNKRRQPTTQLLLERHTKDSMQLLSYTSALATDRQSITPSNRRNTDRRRMKSLSTESHTPITRRTRIAIICSSAIWKGSTYCEWRKYEDRTKGHNDTDNAKHACRRRNASPHMRRILETREWKLEVWYRLGVRFHQEEGERDATKNGTWEEASRQLMGEHPAQSTLIIGMTIDHQNHSHYELTHTRKGEGCAVLLHIMEYSPAPTLVWSTTQHYLSFTAITHHHHSLLRISCHESWFATEWRTKSNQGVFWGQNAQIRWSMLILTRVLRMTDMIILMNREAEDTCVRRTMAALVVHFLTALKMSRWSGLSNSVSLYLTWLIV